MFARKRRKVMADEQVALDAIMAACADRVRALVGKNRVQEVVVERIHECIGIRAARPEDVEKLRVLMVRDMPELDVMAAGEGLEAQLNEPPPKTREPVVVEYSRSLFPVILIILLVRSFLGEPYRIPSESMMPNLLIGDFILVNKYAYGLRLPVLDTKVVPVGEPQRGDVIVFHPPLDGHENEVWIKRVIGLPGDVIAYHNYQLMINGQPIENEQVGPYLGHGSGSDKTGWQVVREKLPERTHSILQATVPEKPSADGTEQPIVQDAMQDPRANGTWTVPAGEYFMMGDNRDDSEDSRFWPTNFLPERNIVGKAVLVWMNFDWDAKKVDSSRIGTIIR
ncbi:MAG TPA: signal peptidase I [Xanthomonadaceae bacterium]|nr:signal peptidase I [Xanthomonadaceae bacterium]